MNKEYTKPHMLNVLVHNNFIYMYIFYFFYNSANHKWRNKILKLGRDNSHKMQQTASTNIKRNKQTNKQTNI